VEWIDQQRSAEEEAHLGLGHSRLQLGGHVLGHVVALLDVDLVDAAPEGERCGDDGSEDAHGKPGGSEGRIIIHTMKDPRELKDTGLKVTVPRLKVLDLFRHSPERHLTAEDVYRKLLDEHSDVGLATVYRVLTQFEQAGILMRHHFEGGKAVYELNEGGHHDHLVCLQCGRVEEFYDSEIEKRQIKVAKERGFQIHDHQLYLYADCIKAQCPHRPKG
jgi:Fur family transcriptional regulator, ferric uptake regulator